MGTLGLPLCGFLVFWGVSKFCVFFKRPGLAQEGPSWPELARAGAREVDSVSPKKDFKRQETRALEAKRPKKLNMLKLLEARRSSNCLQD